MGTRAMTFIEPYDIWIITQFDGYPNGLGRNLRKAIKDKLAKDEFLEFINHKCEIRANGKTQVEALKSYLGKDIPLEELERERDIFIEFIWKVTKDWKLERQKFDALDKQGEPK